MKDSDQTRVRGAVLVERGGEGSNKAAHGGGCFAFVFQQLHRLETGMVVDENEGVLVESVVRAEKRTSDVCVNQPAGVESLVLVRRVWLPCRVGFGAGLAPGMRSVGERRRGVGRDVGKVAQVRSANVESTVHVARCVRGGHDADMVRCALGVNGQATVLRGGTHFHWRQCGTLGHGSEDVKYGNAGEGDDHAASVGSGRRDDGELAPELALGLGGVPQLRDQEEEFAEGGHATNILKTYTSYMPSDVSNRYW
eukprot:6195233-Pleurochrysis_carterae.AAC.2